jgi:aminoglycoside/choline kinase family phosphotransferase
MIEINLEQARAFLKKNKIENYQIKKVAGDASFRSYYRIFYGEKTYILMFAPPKFEDVKPFVKIAEFLFSNNFSAPQIFACDYQFGFLLLEDFGNDTYSKILLRNQNLELEIYQKACDCLLELQKITAPQNVAQYNNSKLFCEVMLFVDWYLPLQKKEMNLQEKSEFKFLWFKLFDLLDKQKKVLVLRDFHADNLMILQNKNVGLLDFQDALIGLPAYDLVSLLEDVRRDVSEETSQKILKNFLQNFSGNKEQFLIDYQILSLQRNVKIIGIFSRLYLRDGKNTYLNFMPRAVDLVRFRLDDKNLIFKEICQLLKKFI